jgi:hypothetical protein
MKHLIDLVVSKKAFFVKNRIRINDRREFYIHRIYIMHKVLLLFHSQIISRIEKIVKLYEKLLKKNIIEDIILIQLH